MDVSCCSYGTEDVYKRQVVATCIVGAGSYGVYQLNNENHMADRLSKAATTAQMTEDTDTTTDTKSHQKKENKQQQDKKQDKKQSDQTEIRNLYEQVLTDVQNGKYEFTQMENNTCLLYTSGIIFIILSATNVREAIFNAIPKNLKAAVSVGIGLFIAFIGLQNAKIVIGGSTLLQLYSLDNYNACLLYTSRCV